MKPVNVMIGYDIRQPVAFQVAAHSVWQHASCPVNITRLDIRTLPMKRVGLTEFTYTRFLAPYLCDYEGISMFMDSDVLVRSDVAELLAYPIMFPDTPVFVVKGEKKFEWASVMVFHNALCDHLTPSSLSDPQRNPLAFQWADTVGELPKDWNHLVGYDKPNPKAKLVHFTQGIPVWDQTRQCEHANEWHEVLQDSCKTVSFNALMGQSVHIQHMKVGA